MMGLGTRRVCLLGLICCTLLIAPLGCGGGSSSAAPTTVAAPPVVAFGVAPGAPAAGQTVTFTDASTNTPTGWFWSFGDGASSTQQSPTHVFATAGTYAVTLTASNAGGASPVGHSITVAGAPVTPSYPVVDTGQVKCYSSTLESPAPTAGQAFFGQDAQTAGTQPSYTLSGDGRTILDNITRLTWMRGPKTPLATPTRADKKTQSQAQAWVTTVNAMAYGGFSDWRLPSIKELYSLMSFRGTDPSSYTGPDTSVLTPFIDTAYFRFAYGDTTQGERLIDSQYASSNVFVVNPAETGWPKLFGLNLADGRIKGYDLIMPDGVTQKTFFVQLVRGRSDYATNTLADNGDGTVSDAATGLMWAAGDSGVGMTWQEALAWVQANNAASYLGHRDWRLPNAKELHSLVNYANAPD